MATVLHLAPHPDDELIGAPATLMALRDAGHEIVNYAAGLGSDPALHETRAAELAEACRRAGFALVFGEPEPGAIAAAVARTQAALVVSPSPDDGHPHHEAVGRAARAALERAGGPRWWMWGLWADLPRPNLLVPFGEERLDEILAALSAHASQVLRNDVRALVRGRALATAVLGPERVFGFGSPGIEAPYAEVLKEAVHVDGVWRAGRARTLDPAEPLTDWPGPPPR